MTSVGTLTGLTVNSGGTNNVATFESTDAGALISLKDDSTTGTAYVGLRADGDILKLRSGNANQVEIAADGNATFEGVVRVGNGSTSAPSLSFGDDNNTGIFRLGADELGFVTGGSQHLTIASDGKVGIGTTSPATPLHISDDAHAIMRLQNEGSGNTEGPTVELYGNTGRMGLLGFDNSDDIRIKNETSAGKLFFFTNNTVRATVLADGKVGIGTDAPSRILEVAADVPALRLTDNNNAGVYHEILGDGASLSIEADDNDQAADSSINFKVDGSQKATITSDGRLGIGTTSPAHPLDVVGEARFSTSVQFNNGGQVIRNWGSGAIDNLLPGSTFGGILEGNSSGHFVLGIRGNDSNDSFSVISGGGDQTTNGYDTVVAYFGANGEVGIGTSSPSATLDVNGRLLVRADGGDILRLRDTGSTTTGGYISFEQSAGTRIGYVGYPNNDDLYINNEMSSGLIYLRTNDTTRMLIQADGDVGIGTTSPLYRLHVNSGTTNTVAEFESTDAAAYIAVSDNSTSSGTQVAVGAVGNELRLRAGNTNHVTLETGGTLKLNTNNIYTAASGATLVAANPTTGTGNDAEWAAPFGIYVLQRNSSLRSEKENIQDPGDQLTADMIDQVEPKLWNRIHAPGYPEIGPIAEDMDAISPFLAAHGTTAEGEQFLTGINKTAYLSLLVLAVKNLRQRVVELENA